MYKLFKKLAGISIFYSCANSIEALSPFILAIILTRFLDPHDYGVWVLFISLVGFLRPIVNLTVQDALKMHYYEMCRERRTTFVVSAFYLSTASALFLALVAVLFGEVFEVMLQFPARWVVAIVVAAYLYVNFYFVLTYNQFAEKRSRFIVLQFVQSLLGIALITALVYQGWGWQGVVIGKTLGLLAACGLGVFWLAGDLDLSPGAHDRRQIKDLLKFGLLYLPAGLGLVAVPLTDRLIVTHVLGLSANGLYGIGALFGSALFVGISGFLYAWMPWLFQRLGESQGDYKKEISAVSLGFLLLLPVVGFFFCLISIFLAPYVIGAAFSDAFVFIPWAIAGIVAMGYSHHNLAFLHFKKAVVPMSISSTSCIVLNIILSYFGAVYFGIAGVFGATVFAYLSSAIISGIFIVMNYNLLTFDRREHA